MFNQPVIIEMKRLRKANLWDAIDARDIRNGHPRAHGCHVASLNALVVLLKMLIRLNGAGGCETGHDQSQAQQEACIKKLDACFQATRFPLQCAAKNILWEP